MTLWPRCFGAPQSVTVQRIVFRKANSDWVSLSTIMLPTSGAWPACVKFGTSEEEIIKDQLAEHTTNPRLREKLFMSPDT